MPRKPTKKRTVRKYRKPKSGFQLSGTVDAMDVAMAAYNGVKALRGLVNSEMFKKDTSVTLGAAQSNIVRLTDISQGDTVSGRQGNSILLRNITIKGKIEINAAVTGNSAVMIALVQDTQQVSDTTPAVADIFTAQNDPHTLLNVGTQGRFKVIKRWNYILTPAAGGANAKQLDYWKSLYTHVRYNGSGSTDLQKNQLYLVMITSENTNYPTIALNARVGYRDN